MYSCTPSLGDGQILYLGARLDSYTSSPANLHIVLGTGCREGTPVLQRNCKVSLSMLKGVVVWFRNGGLTFAS